MARLTSFFLVNRRASDGIQPPVSGSKLERWNFEPTPEQQYDYGIVKGFELLIVPLDLHWSNIFIVAKNLLGACGVYAPILDEQNAPWVGARGPNLLVALGKYLDWISLV